MKNSKYIFKAIPKPGILDANDYSDDVPLAELTGYDGTYVYGWYVDGFIVGQVMDSDDEYIVLEYWVPVDPETVCLVEEARCIACGKPVDLAGPHEIDVIEDYVSYWGTVHNPDTAPSSMPIYYHKECWPQPMEEARHD